MQIMEDYVSFEIAKLLKEKRFDGDTSCYYTPDNEKRWVYQHYQDFDKKDRIECPTLQMAMKWLREVHHIFIQIDYVHSYAGTFEYSYEIHNMSKGRSITTSTFNDNYETYEKAIEAAIKYCLTNLI